MIASVTVPVAVSPEAAKVIAERGYQAQFEQFVAKSCELIPEVRRIEARLSHADDGAFEDGVTVITFTNACAAVLDAAEQAVSNWKVASFPTEVWLTFDLLVLPEDNHAR